jgi:hypothetical protein
MYKKRFLVSATLAILIILIHQYIQGIPDILQLLTDSVLALMTDFSWYNIKYDLYIQLAILVLVPIIISSVIKIFSNKILKIDFSRKIATAWLIWLFLAIPHIIV